MFIPAYFGRLRFEGDVCFLEHRSTSNHLLRTRLVSAGTDGTPGTAAEAVSYFRNKLGHQVDAQVFIDGFLAGEGTGLELAVRTAIVPPTHNGILIFSGARSLLEKAVGTRLLKRLGDPVTATQMLRSCGKQNGDQIEVVGAETLSSNGVPAIEIDTVVGC